jgi:hypothetical protein
VTVDDDGSHLLSRFVLWLWLSSLLADLLSSTFWCSRFIMAVLVLEVVVDVSEEVVVTSSCDSVVFMFEKSSSYWWS